MSKVYSLNDMGYRFRGFARGTPNASCVFDIRQFPERFGKYTIHARSTCIEDSKHCEIFEYDVLECKSPATELFRRHSTGKLGPLLFAVVWRSGEPRLIDQEGGIREYCLESDKWLRYAKVVGNLVLDETLRSEFTGYVELP